MKQNNLKDAMDKFNKFQKKTSDKLFYPYKFASVVYFQFDHGVKSLGFFSASSDEFLFLHCSLMMRLWHRLFQLAKMDWVPPRSIFDMLSINYNGFGSSKRGIVLWQAESITLIWVVW